MFRLNQAALLSSQLIVMYQVFAGTVDYTDIHVFRGESVTLTCNTSKENATLIMWTKGRSIFSYAVIMKLNSSNFTSDRVKIDLSSPLKLNVSNAQQNDTGLYTCSVTGTNGSTTRGWNLTVSEKVSPVSEENTVVLRYFLYILTSVIGFLLCVFTTAVCLWRKHRARTPNQSRGQDQFHLESGGEVAVGQPQAGTDRARNNKRRSQYIERLNSIYDVY